MTTKSKFAVVLALATLGIASPALAQSRVGADWNAPAQSRQVDRSVDNPALTGGGSTAYNVNMSTDI
jgi:hypothetical protein